MELQDCFGGRRLEGRTVVLLSSSNSILANRFYTEIITESPETEIFRIDIDKNKDVASFLNIKISPLVQVYQDNVLVGEYNYTQKDALLCLLKS